MHATLSSSTIFQQEVLTNFPQLVVGFLYKITQFRAHFTTEGETHSPLDSGNIFTQQSVVVHKHFLGQSLPPDCELPPRSFTKMISTCLFFHRLAQRFKVGAVCLNIAEIEIADISDILESIHQ